MGPLKIRKWKQNLKLGCNHTLVPGLLFKNYFLAIAVKSYIKRAHIKLFYPCSILPTFLHFCVLTFLYFFTFEKFFSLILGSISTISLSWLKATNKMFDCWVSVTWLFWLKVSSRGSALYFQDIVRGETLLYEVFTRNSASISSTTWIGILVGLIQQFLFLCHTLW